MTIDTEHVLEVAIVVPATLATTFRAAHHAIYGAGGVAAVPMAKDLPHPTNLGPEARRGTFTDIGLSTGHRVLVLAGAHPDPRGQNCPTSEKSEPCERRDRRDRRSEWAE